MILLSVVMCALVCAAIGLSQRKQRYPFPPGPLSHPLIGHALKLPKEKLEEKLHQWAQTYGDVMRIWIPGRTLIVLNSDEVANDLLTKRSAKYSSRPHFPVYDMMGWWHTMTLVPYGKAFVRQRKMLDGYLNSKHMESYHHILLKEARTLLQNLLARPESYDAAFGRFAAAVIVKITYGHDITSDDDPYFKVALDANYAINNAGPIGNTPIDFFPWLKYFPSWFPGTYYAGYARRMLGPVRKFHDFPYDEIRRQLKEKHVEPSFLASQIEQMDDAGITDSERILELKGVSGVMFVGAADTTSSTLATFLLLMVLNPECMKKAQDEIDRVVGRNRLPDFSDWESLPYVECIVHEASRWYPIVPAGVPHLCTEDDVYKDMYIPKGSIVLSNLRGITWDERVYRNPKAFIPERFLPKPIGYDEPFPGTVFGYGRRICPGRYLALRSLWIVAASIIGAFDISKTLGPDGREIDPKVEFSVGLVHHPKTFKFELRPRSKKSEELDVASVLA